MSQRIEEYFASRAIEEERLAASSIHPAVRATHESFAATYRAHADGKPLNDAGAIAT